MDGRKKKKKVRTSSSTPSRKRKANRGGRSPSTSPIEIPQRRSRRQSGKVDRPETTSQSLPHTSFQIFGQSSSRRKRKANSERTSPSSSPIQLSLRKGGARFVGGSDVPTTSSRTLPYVSDEESSGQPSPRRKRKAHSERASPSSSPIQLFLRKGEARSVGGSDVPTTSSRTLPYVSDEESSGQPSSRRRRTTDGRRSSPSSSPIMLRLGRADRPRTSRRTSPYDSEEACSDFPRSEDSDSDDSLDQYMYEFPRRRSAGESGEVDTPRTRRFEREATPWRDVGARSDSDSSSPVRGAEAAVPPRLMQAHVTEGGLTTDSEPSPPPSRDFNLVWNLADDVLSDLDPKEPDTKEKLRRLTGTVATYRRRHYEGERNRRFVDASRRDATRRFGESLYKFKKRRDRRFIMRLRHYTPAQKKLMINFKNNLVKGCKAFHKMLFPLAKEKSSTRTTVEMTHRLESIIPPMQCEELLECLKLDESNPESARVRYFFRTRIDDARAMVANALEIDPRTGRYRFKLTLRFSEETRYPRIKLKRPFVEKLPYQIYRYYRLWIDTWAVAIRSTNLNAVRETVRPLEYLKRNIYAKLQSKDIVDKMQILQGSPPSDMQRARADLFVENADAPQPGPSILRRPGEEERLDRRRRRVTMGRYSSRRYIKCYQKMGRKLKRQGRRY